MKNIFYLFFFSIFCSAQLLVPSQYSTIQEAIDSAEDGQTIIVSSQINNYFGLIEVNKELDIISDSDDVIIESSDQEFAIKILANNVTISGFEIIGNEFTNAGIIITPGSQNITISNNDISGMSLPNPSNESPLSYGILVYGNSDVIEPPSNIIISDNFIHDISGSAISLGSNTSNVSILNNIISEIIPVQDVIISIAIGINGEYSDNVLIQNNSFFNVLNASNLLASTGSILDNDYTDVTILLSTYLDDIISFSTNVSFVEQILDNFIFYFFQDTILGCIDALACNYNENATDDNGLCVYTVEPCDTCSGETDGTGLVLDNDADDDGVCDADEILGCIDALACNYNENATDDNGLCVYTVEPCDTCSGETDGTGLVLDNDADDDGVCDADEILGCTDIEACNYNLLATDEDGSCIYPEETYLDCNGDCFFDLDLDGFCDEIDEDIDGDGMDNNWENEYGFDPYNPLDAFNDFDEDGLTNLDEYNYSTNPINSDTDGDGISDYDEINDGLNPLLANTDCDEDGIFDYDDTDSCIIFIPEGFSPNGDGYNDYFKIIGLENLSPENELIIFNRLGQIVFRTKNYENDWDGTNSYSSGLFSNQLTTGTYFYVFRTINAVSIIGDREYKGYIYINR